MIAELLANTVNLGIFVVVNGFLIHLVSGLLGFVERHIIISFFISLLAGIVGLVLNLGLLFIPWLAVQVPVLTALFVANSAVFVLLIKKICTVPYLHAFVAWVLIALADLVIGFLIGVLLAVTTAATLIYWIPLVSITALILFGVWFAVRTVRRREALTRAV